MRVRTITGWILCCFAAVVPAQGGQAIELAVTLLDQAQVQARYGLVSATGGDVSRFAQSDPFAMGDADADEAVVGEKSPVKALFLSLAVPGAGQWYYGSRVKPFVFLGIEALAWGLHANYHYNGEDMTDEFEAFNRAHWSRDDYSTYLDLAYNGLTIEELEDTVIPGLTHHLPDTRTQQYYEMTGKYNQFAWGWDDANLNDTVLSQYSETSRPPTIDLAVPISARRDAYEEMRGDANHEFKKAGRMLVAVVTNHVVSALEAFFMTRHRNAQLRRGGDEGETFMSNLSVRPALKSVYRRQDTPYVQVSYSF